MHRITKADLYRLLDLINRAAGQNPKAWNDICANAGTYVLDWAYGGVRLCQLCNENGGQRDITRRGTKRETYHQMRAFLAGIEATPGTCILD